MKYLILATALVLAAAGCVQESSITGMSSLPMDRSIEIAREYMENNEGNTFNGTIEEDRGFEGVIIKVGNFQGVAYPTSGGAGIAEKDGKHYIVFSSDFSTRNGVDLALYLTKNMGYPTRDDVNSAMLIRRLKSTTGMQVYELPPVNLNNFHSVTIMSRALSVPWGYAPLK